jgi:hypothetical protein
MIEKKAIARKEKKPIIIEPRIHVTKYLDKHPEKPIINSKHPEKPIINSMLKSVFGGEMHTEKEWESIIKKELTRRY